MQYNTIELYEKQLTMRMPEEFTAVSDEQKAGMFRGTAPDYVYIWNEKRAIVTVQKTDNDLQEMELQDRMDEYEESYRDGGANYENVSTAVRYQNDHFIGALRYSTGQGPRAMFNYIVVVSIEGKEHMLSLHGPLSEASDAGEVCMKIIESITIK